VSTPQQPATTSHADLATAADIKRDLQATLAARRELGPEYDEHFLNALVEKLTAVQRAQQPSPQPPARHAPPTDQQLGLAICSLIFGIPLVAIAAGALGSPGVVVAFVALLALNYLFDRPR
jgi:hypothetical protein